MICAYADPGGRGGGGSWGSAPPPLLGDLIDSARIDSLLVSTLFIIDDSGSETVAFPTWIQLGISGGSINLSRGWGIAILR